MTAEHLRRNLPLWLAVVALTATWATISPEGSGPGVTCDELYHVAQGKHLIAALKQQGAAFFLPANIERNFPWRPGGPPVQAPLGHWILGAAHHLLDPAPDNLSAISITSARFAPALAFAGLVFMVGFWTARRRGWFAGGMASLSVALMPRLFAHAHLAALDMLTTFFFVAAVLAMAEAIRGGKTWHFALAGAVWGAAMLTRLHGLLVAPPVLLWAMWQFHQGKRAWPQRIKALAVWGTAGAATLFLGWPWLWLAPIARLQQWLSSGTSRQTLHVFYAGRVWADRDVPWHYPWVVFLVTVPVGLVLLGLWGFWTQCRDDAKPSNAESRGEGMLLLGCLLFVLAVFSWPGAPVYDGERLFLMAFPFWAIGCGFGTAWLESRLRERQISLPHIRTHRKDRAAPFAAARRAGWLPAAVVAGFVVLQGIGVVRYHPYQLSYYNLAVGGLAGAEKLGFEVTYWGDTVREPLLAEAARRSPGRPVLFAPSLAPFQTPAVAMSSPALLAAETALIGWDSTQPEEVGNCRYAIVYHRKADLGHPGEPWRNGRVVKGYSLGGVWLARLIALKSEDH